MLNKDNIYIQNKYIQISEKFGVETTNRLLYLYDDVSSPLDKFFSLTHFQFNRLFKYVNSRLTNGKITAHESRELIFLIEECLNINANLSGTPLNFTINEEYLKVIKSLDEFLSETYGSDIPKDFTKITIIENIPIYTLTSYIKRETPTQSNNFYELKLIGEGSYAKVFKYKDTFYNKPFIIKRAKNSLNNKELERFKAEFDIMKTLKSPYVIEVYKYDSSLNQYFMEFADYTLEKYISRNNNKLPFSKRYGLVSQIIKAFEYIHSKNIFHRDVSPNNILLKEYENIHVVKISDFGLVKLPDSTLTSRDTEFKGSFNDPYLELIGFSNYEAHHETYALTRIIYFIMEGKLTLQTFFNKEFELFIKKGTHKDIEKRFASVKELKIAFEKCIQKVYVH